MVVRDVKKIRFFYLCQAFYFPNRTHLKGFLLDLFRKEGFKVDAVNYIFCTDDYLLALNKSHLNHDTFTDIITFDLSATGAPVLSDIYISLDRVRENSRIYKAPFSRELHRVIFHGALHLCGYKDKSKTDSVRMKAGEEKYLELYLK